MRAVVAHSDPLVRDVIGAALGEGGIAVTPTSMESVLTTTEDADPDVVVVETARRSHVRSVTQMAARWPVLAVSADETPDHVLGLLQAGVRGFVSDDVPPQRLVTATRTVADGGTALSNRMSRLVLDQWRSLRSGEALRPSRARSLTPREHEILGFVAQGLPAKAIAGELGVSLKTIENHKIRIFDKLGARTQAEAAFLAVSQGLVTSI